MIKNDKQSCTTDSITDVLVTPEILQAQRAVLLHVLGKIVNGFSQLSIASLKNLSTKKVLQNHQFRHIRIYMNDLLF